MRFIKWLGRLLQTQGLLSNKFEKKFISGRPNYVEITKVSSFVMTEKNIPTKQSAAAAICMRRGLPWWVCALCLGCVVSMRQIGRCHQWYQWHETLGVMGTRIPGSGVSSLVSTLPSDYSNDDSPLQNVHSDTNQPAVINISCNLLQNLDQSGQ